MAVIFASFSVGVSNIKEITLNQSEAYIQTNRKEGNIMGNFWKMYEEVKAHEEQAPTQIIEQTKVAPKDPEQPQQANVSRETLSEVAEEEVTTETLEGDGEDGVTSNTDL